MLPRGSDQPPPALGRRTGVGTGPPFTNSPQHSVLGVFLPRGGGAEQGAAPCPEHRLASRAAQLCSHSEEESCGWSWQRRGAARAGGQPGGSLSRERQKTRATAPEPAGPAAAVPERSELLPQPLPTRDMSPGQLPQCPVPGRVTQVLRAPVPPCPGQHSEQQPAEGEPPGDLHLSVGNKQKSREMSGAAITADPAGPCVAAQPATDPAGDNLLPRAPGGCGCGWAKMASPQLAGGASAAARAQAGRHARLCELGRSNSLRSALSQASSFPFRPGAAPLP